MCKFTFCLVSCPSASDASLGETKTLYADVCSRVSSQVRKMGKRAMRAVLTSEFYCCQARRSCPSKCCRACLHAYTHGSTGWDSFFHGVTCFGTFEHSLCMLPNTINFPADRCLQFYIEAAVCIQSCLIQWFYSCLTEATFGYSLQQPLSYEVAYSCQAVCLLCFSEIHFGKKKQTTWKELQMKKGMHCSHSPAHRTCMLYVYVCVILRNKSTLYRYMQCHNRHVPVYIEDTTRSSQWQRWKERKKRDFMVKLSNHCWTCGTAGTHWNTGILMTGRCRAIWILTCPGLKQTQILDRYFNFHQFPTTGSCIALRGYMQTQSRFEKERSQWSRNLVWSLEDRILFSFSDLNAFYSACLRPFCKCCHSCRTKGCQSTFATLVMACPGTQFLLSGAI